MMALIIQPMRYVTRRYRMRYCGNVAVAGDRGAWKEKKRVEKLE